MQDNQKIANKLYKLADGLKEQINHKLNPPCGSQNYTARRARMVANMRKEGENLEKIQYVLNGLGMLHENNFSHYCDPKPFGYNTKDVIKKITTKKMIECVLLHSYPSEKWNLKEIDQLKKVGIDNEEQFNIIKTILFELLEDLPDREKENKRIELENKAKSLIRQIPGFFPTPKNIAIELVNLAKIQQGEKILEPSAGSGNIAEVIRDQGIEPSVIEWNRTLTDLLQLKDFNVIGDDFFKCNDKFDKIIMNPPFENLQDIDHVKHAFDCLNNDGRLVSIMSNSPFFRSDKKAIMFRAWLNNLDYEVLDLPPNAFKESLTGVTGKIIIINK